MHVWLYAKPTTDSERKEGRDVDANNMNSESDKDEDDKELSLEGE